MRKTEGSIYNVDYISGVMSLRKPQTKSLKYLDRVLSEIDLKKGMPLDELQKELSDDSKTFKAFDRNFMSFTFALATGVGKTRLMGAFITYLYNNFGIKNYLVVAPSLTIFNKLTTDLGDPNSKKYVFKGISCFGSVPNIIAGDEYQYKQFSGLSDLNIFILNAQKLNSKDMKRKSNTPHENIGVSFVDYLASVPDLTVLMDESHHYRNDNSTFEVINKINPLLGIETTATPYVMNGKKKAFFQNVLVEYPISHAIRDGFVRTPYALTRKGIEKRNWDPDEMDKMMIDDGIVWHEKIKDSIEVFTKNHKDDQVLGKPIKPFVLVVCRDVEHANYIKDYIESNAFRGGKYKGKVLEIDSGKSAADLDHAVQLLLNVEKTDNPIEIVVHVNMLKEGWDVNNLYTIVPLRKADSNTLVEQTIGRGARLPYGFRVGDENIDSVTITAHTNFQAIVAEASKPDSILRKENIIDVENVAPSHPEQIPLNIDYGDGDIKREFIEKHKDEVKDIQEDQLESALRKVSQMISQSLDKQINESEKKVKIEDKDLSQIAEEENVNIQILKDFMMYDTEKHTEAYSNLTIAFPIIEIENPEEEGQFFIEDFDLDISQMGFGPVSMEIFHQNLIDKSTDKTLTNKINFSNVVPASVIVKILREKPEIDYELVVDQLAKLITQYLTYLKDRGYKDEEIKNIVVGNKFGIADQIYKQILKHKKIKEIKLIEFVRGVDKKIVRPTYSYNNDGSNVKELYYELQGENIKSLIFSGGKKSLLRHNKFDSRPEKDLAIACDTDNDVEHWLRPAPTQFNIFYNHGQRYQPDLVIETKDYCYLVEVKDHTKLDDDDVIKKRKCAVSYCKLSSEWCEANGHKPWKHLFIPDDKISTTSKISDLIKLFEVKE